MSDARIMNHHRPRLVDSLLLGTRQAAAMLVNRHPDLVRRHCAPVACDVKSRALLYDLFVVDAELATRQRRHLTSNLR